MAHLPSEPDIRLEMLSQPRFLAAARAMVHNFAQRLGFADGTCAQISLAVDEALCNIINHGYDRKPDGRIWLSLWAIDGAQPADRPGMRVMIEDRARQVDPAKIKSRDLSDIRPGGLGVHIIREVMDDVRYEHREGGGMRLTMSKRLPDHAVQSPHDCSMPDGAGASAKPAAPHASAAAGSGRRQRSEK